MNLRKAVSPETPIKDERFYQERFARCRKPKYLAGSTFYREIPLSYSQEPKSKGTNEMPNAAMDFLELDKQGFLHLWEAKKLHSYELKSGRIIGQMMFYDWLFRTNRVEYNKSILSDFCVPVKSIQRYEMKSWNILICGGYGYEIAAPFNPVIWNYQTIPSEYYFRESAPSICVWHMFHAKYSGTLVVEPLWKLSIFHPTEMHEEALLAFLESDYNVFYDYQMLDGRLKLRMVFDELEESVKRRNESDEIYWELMGRSHLYPNRS